MYVFNSYTTNTIAVICIGLHGTLALNGANYPFTIVLNFDFLLVGRSCFLFKEMDNLVLFFTKICLPTFIYVWKYLFTSNVHTCYQQAYLGVRKIET